MSILLLIARWVLAVVFAIAGITKLADPKGSRKTMADFGVPGFLAGLFAWLVPIAELACAIALIPTITASWGATGVLILLALFTLGVSISLIQGRKPDCHCFGQIHSSPISWRTLVRNLALAAVAALIVWQGPATGEAGASSGLNLTRSETAILVLALAFIALTTLVIWMFLHLLRQHGRFLLRLEAVEGKAGVTAEAPPPGLPVQTPAPAFSLAGLDGDVVTLNTLQEQGKPVLLFFIEPSCGACEAELPEVARWQREFADRLVIVPISRGTIEANRTKTAAHNLQYVLLQKDREVAEAYHVQSTPAAVLLRGGVISTPLAIGSDEIRAVVGNATLPPSVKKGDPVPSLRLADLKGATVDLSRLRGRRTLLLFWNPTCGYCQQMLPDVKAWEQNPPKDAPDLMIVSAGTIEANREHGFRSRVLLDKYFGAGKVFGAEGTPSGVMLDEDGRVASEVGVGASAVFALITPVPAPVRS